MLKKHICSLTLSSSFVFSLSDRFCFSSCLFKTDFDLFKFKNLIHAQNTGGKKENNNAQDSTLHITQVLKKV